MTDFVRHLTLAMVLVHLGIVLRDGLDRSEAVADHRS